MAYVLGGDTMSISGNPARLHEREYIEIINVVYRDQSPQCRRKHHKHPPPKPKPLPRRLRTVHVKHSFKPPGPDGTHNNSNQTYHNNVFQHYPENEENNLNRNPNIYNEPEESSRLFNTRKPAKIPSNFKNKNSYTNGSAMQQNQGVPLQAIYSNQGRFNEQFNGVNIQERNRKPRSFSGTSNVRQNNDTSQRRKSAPKRVITQIENETKLPPITQRTRTTNKLSASGSINVGSKGGVKLPPIKRSPSPLNVAQNEQIRYNNTNIKSHTNGNRTHKLMKQKQITKPANNSAIRDHHDPPELSDPFSDDDEPEMINPEIVPKPEMKQKPEIINPEIAKPEVGTTHACGCHVMYAKKVMDWQGLLSEYRNELMALRAALKEREGKRHIAYARAEREKSNVTTTRDVIQTHKRHAAQLSRMRLEERMQHEQRLFERLSKRYWNQPVIKKAKHHMTRRSTEKSTHTTTAYEYVSLEAARERAKDQTFADQSNMQHFADKHDKQEFLDTNGGGDTWLAQDWSDAYSRAIKAKSGNAPNEESRNGNVNSFAEDRHKLMRRVADQTTTFGCSNNMGKNCNIGGSSKGISSSSNGDDLDLHGDMGLQGDRGLQKDKGLQPVMGLQPMRRPSQMRDFSPRLHSPDLATDLSSSSTDSDYETSENTGKSESGGGGGGGPIMRVATTKRESRCSKTKTTTFKTSYEKAMFRDTSYDSSFSLNDNQENELNPNDASATYATKHERKLMRPSGKNEGNSNKTSVNYTKQNKRKIARSRSSVSSVENEAQNEGNSTGEGDSTAEETEVNRAAMERNYRIASSRASNRMLRRNQEVTSRIDTRGQRLRFNNGEAWENPKTWDASTKIKTGMLAKRIPFK